MSQILPKNGGLSSLGWVPDNWEITTFKDISELRQGLQIAISKRYKNYKDGRFIYITVEYLNNPNNQNLLEYIDSPSNRVICQTNDVLVARTGATGKIITGVKGVFHNNFFLVEYDRKKINKNYLVQYLKFDHVQKEIKFRAGTTTIPDLNHGDFYSLTFIQPSIQEQQKIAEILDTVDRAIALTQTHITKLKQAKAGLLHDLLTRGINEHGELRNPTRNPEQFKDSPLGKIPKDWEVCPIEDKLKKIIDYRGKTPEKVESGIPLITAKNVRDGFIDADPCEYIDEKSYKVWMTRGIPTEKDVLFTTEAPLGNVSLIPNYKIALAQRLLTLCPDKTQLNSDFLIWLLLLPASKTRLQQHSTGSTVLGIKQSVFRKIIFQFSQLHEQEIIASIMNAHEKRIQSKVTYLEKLKLLKKGLMSDLLTGKVRVKI